MCGPYLEASALLIHTNSGETRESPPNMKRTFLISSLMLLALGCARDPVEAPPAGGQSGDDGDAIPPGPPGPPGPGPIQPGLPQLPPGPCDPEQSSLALDAPTAFGGSTAELLGQLDLGAPSPLFWVPRSAPPAVTFTPGPSETSLSLDVAARAAGGQSPQATQTLWRPKFVGAVCPEDNLALPVSVSLRSSDGALDEQVDGVLSFSSASTAHLDAALQPDALDGTFAYTQIGAPGENWRADNLTVSADFWPGGSRGALWPSFTAELDPSTIATPPTSTPAPSIPSAGAGILTPTVPTGWGSVAVWPRREACDSESRGVANAYAPSDHIIGRSLADVVAEQNSRSSIELASGQALTPVSFTLEAPTGLQCVRVSGRSMTFDVRATLRADAAVTPQSPLSNLAASSVFELTATSARDGSGIEALHWVRRDVVWAQDRAGFETATGIALGAAEQYQQVWWSWHGTETRANATSPWTSLGELAVHSLNAQEAAALERQQAQGGPGAGISFDAETGFPQLPGDALIEAEISP
jgi:hypothetical protein